GIVIKIYPTKITINLCLPLNCTSIIDGFDTTSAANDMYRGGMTERLKTRRKYEETEQSKILSSDGGKFIGPQSAWPKKLVALYGYAKFVFAG
ncbi:hypothetical protein ACJX0J_025339, partial [Zea mays]